MIVFEVRAQFKDRSLLKLPRKFKRLVKESLRSTVEYWHDDILPRHWFTSARSQYNYEPRDPEWLEAKRFIGDGQGKYIDALLHGKTRRFMMVDPRITATARSATVRMDSPIYVRSQKKADDHPMLRDELTRVSNRDERDLKRHLERDLEQRVKRLERT